MNERHVSSMAKELGFSSAQVQAVAELLETGATIPFVARYRKEATGSLDEVAIAAIRDGLARLDALEKRAAAVLKSIGDQGKLTDDLKARVLSAASLSELEDIYLPFRPKRRTRAAMAREKGLEPLAELLLAQAPGTDPFRDAAGFVDPEKGVGNAEDALAGARDIIAERVSEDAEVRARLRTLFSRRGTLRARLVPGKEEEALQYRDYFDWEEALKTAPSHRVLATLRGEKEGFLSVDAAVPEDEALAVLESAFVRGDSAASAEVRAACQDGWKRLLNPSMETETRQSLKERADAEAIRIFADNLRHLLMAPPLGGRRVLALDPGFRTGCKTVCLDSQGKLLRYETVFPHTGNQAAARAAEQVRAMVAEFQIEAVAIGNGTAGRETETFVRGLGLPPEVQIVMVDESGASVYSASAVAREEFPDQDVTVRGAVSIGRRLMDPLSELVKIDPKSIGVGQYQHDVDQGELRRSLDDTVMSCVNGVGVEVNTASPQLLGYVSGLGPQLARNIVSYRNENGPFASRRELRKVPRLGPKAFEQAAGFLRIRDGANPLDASAVHPESYPVVQAMARDLGCAVSDLMKQSDRRERIALERYVTAETGLPTLRDILAELARPGRDPRESFEAFSFAPGIERLSDLEPGMKLPGLVTNVTAFGAFVDVGVHRDGLVHVSELSDHFVKDPNDVVRVRQKVMVTVLEVDAERGRISFSMKSVPGKKTERESGEKTATGKAGGRDREKPERPRPPDGGGRGKKPKPPSGGGGFNNPFERAFRKP